MKNFVQEGQILDITLAAAITSGSGLLIGTVLGVAQSSGAIGDVVPFCVEGVYTLPKVTGTAVTLGAAAYWDDTAKKVTPTAGSLVKIGWFTAAALSAATEVDVKLLG